MFRLFRGLHDVRRSPLAMGEASRGDTVGGRVRSQRKKWTGQVSRRRVCFAQANHSRETMAYPLLGTLLDFMEVLRPALTRPGFNNLVVLMVGWVLTQGPHAVTQALVCTQVAGRRHHEAFHRFFSRGTWDPDQWGRLLFEWILAHAPIEGPVRLCLDDTLAPKKGAQVFGIGSHLDAVRSSRLCRIFAFGHCWVVLAVLVKLPFSQRPWALPILFRLYRSKQSCDLRRRD